MLDTILLALILLFTFLTWLRNSDTFIRARRRWRIWRRGDNGG